MLLWMCDARPRYAFVIPGLWAVTGIFAALQLGVIEDLSLTASALVVAFVLSARPVRAHAGSDKTGRSAWSRLIAARH
jgi:hypothetical protein